MIMHGVRREEPRLGGVGVVADQAVRVGFDVGRLRHGVITKRADLVGHEDEDIDRRDPEHEPAEDALDGSEREADQQPC